MNTDRLRAAAIESAQAGFPVFAVVPRGKKPLRKGWRNSATTDPGVIEAVWKDAPEANIGVLTGRDLLVVDADTPEAVDALRSLGLPETTTVRTSRGKHFYLIGSSRNRTGLLPGVDIRGEGGYVVGAGSLHPSGTEYQWEVPPWDLPPAAAPRELLALRPTKPAVSKLLAEHAVIEKGTRNSTLFILACSLRGLCGLRLEEIREAISAANRVRCKPPLDGDEVEQIARSAARYDMAPLWATDPVAFATDPALASKERHLLSTLARYCNHEGVCWPGVRRLRKDTGMATKTIERATHALIERSRITVERRRNRSNLYRLHEKPQRPGTTRAPRTGSSVLHARTPRGGAAT